MQRNVYLPCNDYCTTLDFGASDGWYSMVMLVPECAVKPFKERVKMALAIPTGRKYIYSEVIVTDKERMQAFLEESLKALNADKPMEVKEYVFDR